ncbi:S-adenosylmethionine-dependent methyltransferase, partial [Dimargaris xerosporica]
MAAIPLLTAAPLITWLQLGILRQHDPSSQELAAIKVYCLGPQPDQPSSHEDLLVPLEWYAPNSLVHFIQRDAQPLLASVPRTELTLDQLMAWVATERKQTDIASLLRQITAHIFARLVPNPECSCECLVTHLPLKWEQYHQFVLFPPSAFQGDPWATFFAQPIADQALTINSSKTISTGTLSTPAALAYFALIACAFRATHLAAKASIPVGDVMRRPIIVPLYGPWGRAWQKCQRYLSPQHQSEPVSSPIHAKPTTDTFWASTRQNGVEYRWAPLHTMFCAGNITEKLRVATSPWFRVGGGTVVDLYAGVGYFTLPYLVHAGAARVHACELNPWSVQ